MSDKKTKSRQNEVNTKKSEDRIMESGQKRVKRIKQPNPSDQERKPQKENKTPKDKREK